MLEAPLKKKRSFSCVGNSCYYFLNLLKIALKDIS